MQPDFQYVFSPGGGVLNPDQTSIIKNEMIVGLRSAITF
jgi:porin